MKAAPADLAQILLLFRTVLVNGVVESAELAAFERICARRFGIEREDREALHDLLESSHGQAVAAQMTELIGSLDHAARQALLAMMREIALANADEHARAARLIAMTARLLDLDGPGQPESTSDASEDRKPDSGDTGIKMAGE
nr:TerB family tellurite resistance protein [Pseudohoeflea sp. DP4N28-3]